MECHLYATFRLLAKVRSLQIDLPAGSTVLQLIDAVIAQVPAIRPHWLNAAGELHAHVHVFVNGDDVQTLPDGLQTHLDENAVIDFFPPVAGG
jgi:molybdopterin synthase sulfur carrier subunit